jgi:hypothetical protein
LYIVSKITCTAFQNSVRFFNRLSQYTMKKVLLTILLLSFFGLVSTTHAKKYYTPPVDEAIQRLDTWAQDQWYYLPVVRNTLIDAYSNPMYEEQQAYIASLIREVEAVSEEKYRKSPRFELNEDRTVADMYGQIDETIYTKVQSLILQNPNLETIRLIYVPGSWHDINNHKAWRLIRAQGLHTQIPSFGFIASGGTDLLMAGTIRNIEPWAQIGVHAWTSSTYPDPWNLDTNHIAHNEYIDYFVAMGIVEDLYRRTLKNTRPWSIHWLSDEEIQQYWF